MSGTKKKDVEQFESESRFRELFETSRDGIAITDLSGRFLDCNRAYLDLLGYDTIEQLGMKSYKEITPPEYHAFEAGVIASQTLTRGWCDEYEKEYIRKSGERVAVSLRAWLRRDAQGQPSGMWVIVRDITERRRMEKALNENKERLDFLLSTSPAVIYTSKTEGDFGATFISNNVRTMLGYDPRQFIEDASFWASRIHPDDAPRVRAEIPHLYEQGHHSYEYRFQRSDGTYCWMFDDMRLVRNALGKPAEIIGYWVDITERKKVEQNLKESERKYRTLVETADDTIIVTDLQGKHLFANSAYYASLGYAIGEDPNPDGFSNLHPDDAVIMKNRMSELITTGKLVSEYRVRHKDGTWRYRSARSTLIRDDAGNPKMILAICRDVTERKKTEDKLIHNHNLMQYIISHAQSAIAVHDRNMKYVYVSEQYLREYKVKEQDVIGKHHYDVFPDLPQKWRDVHQRVLAGAVESKDEDPYVREDGSVDWTRWECRPWYEPDGSIGGLIVYTEVITERKKTEMLLQQQRRQLEDAQRISHVGSWERDISTNAVRWSDELSRIFGINPGEITPTFQLLLDIMHPDDREPFQKAVKEAVFEKKPYSVEYRIICGDGSTRVIHARGDAEYDGSGKPLIFRGTAQDITERKSAERALLDSEMQYRSLFEQSGDSILVMKIGKDNIPVITDLNKTALLTYGYTREEILGQPISFLDHVANLGVNDDKIRTLKKDNFAFFTTQHERKDGNLIDVEVRARLISIGDEQVIVSSQRDITERKRMEEALRKDEEFIRNILDAVDEVFLVVDRDYRIITANKAYCIFASCDDIIGKHCYAISHKRNIPCYDAGEECAVRTVFETGRPQTSVHTHRDEDGRLIYVETRAFPLKDRSGNVISAIETINNVTEKHLLEEERLKTQKLEAIGTLAGGIAHDFNNLLQGVFGYISLAKLNADQKEKSVEALEQAEKALHMSVNLTSQLLTFSKGGKPVRQRFDLRPVIENAVRFALSGSRSDHLLNMSGGLWAADADSGQIGQVIQNIVLNADQSMPEGGQVEITANNVEIPENEMPQGLENGRYVKISIKDHGVGIPEQYLSKIFDPYFTTKEKGSGLGLATSYSIIRNHGGLIDVQSLPGKGSTFIVYIPAAAPRSTKPVVAAVSKPARRGRILIMDDDEVIRTVAGELIRTLGHDVDFAEHGKAALIKYKAAREAGAPFDIVILDLTVRGGMGGVETIQKLREIDPDVKAIVSSGYSDNAMAAEYQKIGFRSFLKKPYNIEELRTLLNTLLM